MQEINRHNVEAWLLDYQEGRLTEDQSEQLLVFLKSHPDIPVDPDFPDFPVLVPPDTVFPGKTDLFRTEFSIPEADEFDLQCIALLEGDVPDEQKEQFEYEMSNDPEKAKRYQAYRSTRIAPDPTITFGDKNRLKRSHLFLPAYLYGTLAAAAALILAFFIFTPDKQVFLPEESRIAGDTAREVIYLDKLLHPATFDQIADNSPQKTVAIPDQIPETEQEFLLPREIQSMQAMTRIPLRPLSSMEQGNRFPTPVLGYRPEPTRNSQEYQTLLAYSGDLFRTNVLGQDRDLVENSKFSVWELADAGLNRIRNLFHIQAEIGRQYNEEGSLVEVSFESPLLAFTTPVNPRSAQ